MKTFTLDLHHLVLYGLLAIVSLAGLGVIHEWRVDVVKAKAQSTVDEKTIQDTERSSADRAKQYQAQLAFLQSKRVTVKTPAPVIITRLQGLEPEMRVLPDQLVAPKPDAPKVNLVLEPEQQVTLVNRLVDCHECEFERAKLRDDVVDGNTKLKAMMDERDGWRTAAKGGSLKQRIKRRAWSFLEDVIIIEAMRAAAGHP
jgi:hypothetical protein